MTKVKLTQEQADAIEYGKENHLRRTLIDAYTRKKGVFVDELDVLYELDYDDFFRALYVGYEVEPEFSKGDFVVWHGSIVNIKHPQTNDYKDDGSCYFTLERSDGSTYGNISRDEIHHATPSEIAEEKERRWWKKHGREPWELREGDFVVNMDKIAWEVTKVPEGEDYCFIDYTKFHYERIKDSFLILCFVENRLDVKDDE